MYHLQIGGTVIIEGTQGYGLGSHAGYYPHCTSSDCRAIDFLAMAGIPPWSMFARNLEIVIVYRVHPIRIAGNSGPLKGETTWEKLGIPDEFTTVTKKVRRVGAWDADLAHRAFLANGGNSMAVRTALMFTDYQWPEMRGIGHDGRGQLSGPLPLNVVHCLEEMDVLAKDSRIPRFTYLGTSPMTIIKRGDR